MLRYKPLPLFEKLADIEDHEQRRKVITDIFLQIYQHEGMQIIAKCLQEIEADAFRCLKVDAKPQLQVGRMLAVDQLREALAAYLPDNQEPEWEDEAEEEFLPPFSYASPFSDDLRAAEEQR